MWDVPGEKGNGCSDMVCFLFLTKRSAMTQISGLIDKIVILEG